MLELHIVLVITSQKEYGGIDQGAEENNKITGLRHHPYKESLQHLGLLSLNKKVPEGDQEHPLKLSVVRIRTDKKISLSNV